MSCVWLSSFYIFSVCVMYINNISMIRRWCLLSEPHSPSAGGDGDSNFDDEPFPGTPPPRLGLNSDTRSILQLGLAFALGPAVLSAILRVSLIDPLLRMAQSDFRDFGLSGAGGRARMPRVQHCLRGGGPKLLSRPVTAATPRRSPAARPSQRRSWSGSPRRWMRRSRASNTRCAWGARRR